MTLVYLLKNTGVRNAGYLDLNPIVRIRRLENKNRQIQISRETTYIHWIHQLEVYPLQKKMSFQPIMGGSGKSSSTNNCASIHFCSRLDRAQSLSFSKFRHVCACVLYPTTAESSALHCHTFTDMSALHLHKRVLSITSFSGIRSNKGEHLHQGLTDCINAVRHMLFVQVHVILISIAVKRLSDVVLSQIKY